MASISFLISYNIRNTHKELKSFNVSCNLSRGLWSNKSTGLIEKSEKYQSHISEWSRPANTGLSTYFKRHNGFKDQERYDRVSRNFNIRQGTFAKYYATSYDPNVDTLYHEDNNQKIERYFDVPMMLTFQPENEIYNRFGVQYLDEFEVHVHMSLFMELQYNSLKQAGIKPACDPNLHNPIWSQRGYDAFSYYGYTAAQIFPKAGDLIKIESFDTLYTIESVKDASPEYQHRWRKYWWKLFLKDSMDNSKTVSGDVLNNEEQKNFINTLFGNQIVGNNASENGTNKAWPFDASCAVESLKKDILFRPPEVKNTVQNISEDNNYHPGHEKFGKW